MGNWPTGCSALEPCCPAAPPRPAPQILQYSVSKLKGGKMSDYRGCTKDELLQQVARDGRQLYIMLHNIDGPGASVLSPVLLSLQ